MSIYRALLRLYPASFRTEYADEMCALFARQLGQTSGASGRARLWATAVADIAVNAGRVHADMLRQDLRYSLRSLWRTPGFAATAIVVSALGIGATTAAFSVADLVLLRPLPFHEPDRLVKLWEDQSATGYSRMEASPPDFLDWQRLSTSFAGMAAYVMGVSDNLVGVGDPVRLEGAWVSGNLFQVLGREAAMGRALVSGDTEPGAPAALVLSDRLWRLRFGADPAALGRTVTLSDVTYTIVGVMPPDFAFPRRETMFWRPLVFSPENGSDDRNNNYLQVVARLAPGVTFDDARSEMRVVGTQLARAYPKELDRTSVNVIRWRDEVSWQPRLMLFGLMGASLCVLLIACTNLANLLLARGLARQHEFAVRAAVGASVPRLVRQMLTDAAVLAATGGALGLAIAGAAGPIVAKLVPNSLPTADAPAMDLRMLGVAAILTLVTGLAFGVLPAVRACGRADATRLKEGWRGGTGRGTERLRSSLVVAEVAASIVLLVTAGLLVRALWRVQQIDPGFRPNGVLTMRTSLPMPKYQQTSRRLAFYDRVIADVRALPGVTQAAYTSFLPMVMRGGIWPVVLDGTAPTTRLPGEDTAMASLRFVTPGFFDTLGTPLLRGRDLAATDTATSPTVAVVSESFVRTYFDGVDPIGRTFSIAFKARTIVGVVGDIKVRGLERVSEPQVYLPASQVDDGSLVFYSPQDLAVRATVPPATLTPAIRAIIGRADPAQPIASIQLLSDIVADETSSREAQLGVLAAFAVVAVLLAAIGIHGLLAYSVGARRREIGVRMALGAGRGEIVRLVAARSGALAALGIAIGALAAYGVGVWMRALLAGIDPADSLVFTAAVALAGAMTLAGTLSPALRAVKVDPVEATRAD